MQPTIAVVEDEGSLREAVAEYLGDRGFRVLCAANAAEMRSLMQSEAIDLAILDIAMPGEDGLTLARWLRTRSPKPGIIFATAAGSAIDRIVGLEIGADDYVVKPFNPRELLARIRAVLRRSQALPRTPASNAKRIRFDRWTLDVPRQELVGADAVAVPLSTAEFRLLTVFLERPRMVLSREQLLDLTSGRALEPFERSIDNQVSRLRKKVETDPKNPAIIRTVWGGGYSLAADVDEQAA